jgi:hypothetical protein
VNASKWTPIVGQAVAVIALLVTLVTTRLTISAQREIKLTEVKAELFAKTRQAWIADVRRMTSDLLVLCDPDYSPASIAESAARSRDILKAAHTLGRYLDPRDKDHTRFGNAVIRLAMASQRKYASDTTDGALHASAEVIDSAKVVLTKEMKWLESQLRANEA